MAEVASQVPLAGRLRDVEAERAIEADRPRHVGADDPGCVQLWHARETLTALRPAYVRLRAAEWPTCMVTRGITTGGSMRKLMLSAAGLVASADVTSVAVAHGIEGAKTAKAVAGTFTAATSNVSTRPCTTSDGKAIVVTNGKYTGAAAGRPGLAGPITLRAHSVVNTHRRRRRRRRLRSRSTSPRARDTTASYSAVYDHGTIAGLSVGRAHDPSARLVANLSATVRCRDRLHRRQARRWHRERLGCRARLRLVQGLAHEAREEPGTRHDLGALVELDHRRRAHLRSAGRQVGSGDGEVQDR